MAKKKAAYSNNRSARPIHSQIGARIRLARSNSQITQQELAGKLGVSFQQIQKYEKGVNRVDAGRLEQIASALNVSKMWLYGDEENAERISTLGDVETYRAGVKVMKLEDGLRDLVLSFCESAARRGYTTDA